MNETLKTAIHNAAHQYYSAVYYKTGDEAYYEGKAKGLLNYAADVGLYMHPDLAVYWKMVNDADEIRQAATQK